MSENPRILLPSHVADDEITINKASFYNLLDIANKADDIVQFCYSQDGCWIGTETIRKAEAFLELVSKLRDVLYPEPNQNL